MSKKDLIRKKFRDDVFKRDNYTCRLCGKVWKKEESDLKFSKVNAHHITDRHLMPNGGYHLSNGITVCEEGCHMKVERWHILGYDKEDVERTEIIDEKFTPDALYKLIGSSFEIAFRDSSWLSNKKHGDL